LHCPKPGFSQRIAHRLGDSCFGKRLSTWRHAQGMSRAQRLVESSAAVRKSFFGYPALFGLFSPGFSFVFGSFFDFMLLGGFDNRERWSLRNMKSG
jgi:hypothetical protein